MEQQKDRNNVIPPPETYGAVVTGQHYRSDKAYKQANWNRLSAAEQSAITTYERSCSNAAVTMWVGIAVVIAGFYFGGWIIGIIAAVVAWFFFDASGRSSMLIRAELPDDHPSKIR